VLMTMIHDIALAHWVSDSPAVTASATRFDRTVPGSPTTASVNDAGGATGICRAGGFTKPGRVPPDRLEVVGSSGSLEYEAGLGVKCFSAVGESYEATSKDEPFDTELNCFLDEGGPAPVLPEDARDGPSCR
jgi:predicted dehydrogenase